MSDYEYKLSAIVLVYNGGKYLRDCISSLVNQTLDGLEIILINDVSTDDSLSVCREFERDYDNVRIINKEVNEGLAKNANIGIENAKGEYVILVDNDDIVPNYAYERLYNKAKEADADISIGSANFLIGKHQYEMPGYERNAWEKERVINDLEDFPILFGDAFYWNKIIKRDLLIEHNIRLPIDMIYADRKFSHTAYSYARTIAVIPDCVYMWRQRKNSLSDERKALGNYINRIDSYKLDLDKITSSYHDYMKILMRRVTVPIHGILNNEEFEDYLFNETRDFLITETSKINDIYDNSLNINENLYIYLILNNHRKELKQLLKTGFKVFTDVVDENGKSYWNLPLFRNPNINVPDSLFEIKRLMPQFLNVKEIITAADSIIFNEIELPKFFEMKKGEIVFAGRCEFDEVLEENSIHFEVEPIINDEGRNLFKAEIPLNELNIFEDYDIYFQAHHEEYSDNIRFSKDCVENIINENEEIKILFTANNLLSICTQILTGEFEFDCDEETFRILVKNGDGIKKKLKIYVNNPATKEKTYLSLNDDKTAYELKWKFFLDKKSSYTSHLRVHDDIGRANKKVRLTTNNFNDFEDFSLKTENNLDVRVFKTKYGNIRLKTR